MPADLALAPAHSIADEMKSIVGAANLVGPPVERRNKKRNRKDRRLGTRDEAPLGSYAIDEVVPVAVVSPGSEEEIAAILRIASERDYVVVPTGGMTKQNIGYVPDRIDILLRMNRFNKVEHYDAGDLTFGAGAGMTISDVQQTLAANSQMLPLDPMLPDRATVGGVLAANAHGPMKSGFGGARDYCIGVHFVTADGKIAKGGGRVVKNVAGYDMMKLMIGSFGTLGVITSANFKVFPAPLQTRTFVCAFASLAEAIAFRDRVLASPLQPMCVEINSPRAQEYLAAPAAPRDPDHHHAPVRLENYSSWNVLVRASGSDAVLNRYRQELGAAVTREIAAADEKQLWTRISNDEKQLWTRISNFEPTVIDRHRNGMVINVSVSIADVQSALQAAEDSAIEHNLLCASIGRITAGALVIAFMPLAVDPPSAMQFANAASSLRGRLPRDASAHVLRCPKESKSRFDVWGTTPTDLEMMRSLRASMDPHGILNRGRFLA